MNDPALQAPARAAERNAALRAGAHVQYVGESVDGEYATVRTLIVPREIPTVRVDYRLFRRGDQWLV